MLDEEAKTVTNWLQQAFTEFGARLRQQVQRKSLKKNTEKDEQQGRNGAGQAIWETQHDIWRRKLRSSRIRRRSW